MCNNYDEIKKEFRKFLRVPRTKKEIKKRFNFEEQKFRDFIVYVSVNWPVWEDCENTHKYGWLGR